MLVWMNVKIYLIVSSFPVLFEGRGKNTQMKHLTVILFIDNSSGVALFCLILQE